MGGDNLIFNQFERASSADMNNVQRMLRRPQLEFLRWFGGDRPYPAALPGPGSNTAITATRWHVGLTVETTGATSYVVNAGVMVTNSAPNLSFDALDSSQVMAALRSGVTRTIPTANPAHVAGEYWLVSARIVSVVTLNTVVEIFDVPTQTFVPTAKNKRVEYQIEFREDVGNEIPSSPTGGALPSLNAAPTNQGWDPIAVIRVFPNTGTAGHGDVIDVRRDLRDTIRCAPWDPIPFDQQSMQPEVLIRSLESTGHPTNVAGLYSGFHGQFRATYQGKEYSYSARGGDVADGLHTGNALETLNPGALTHVYLVPYKTGNASRIPSYGRATTNDYAKLRGFLVIAQTACPPTREGKNSAAISLANGIYSDVANVAAGEAVYVCSAQTRSGSAPSGATGVWQFIPFTMAGNRHVYPINSSPGSETSAPRALNATLADGSTVHALALANYVPRCARFVELAVRVTNGNTAVGPHRCEVRIAKEDAKIGGTSALLGSGVLDAITIGTGYANTEWWGRMRVPLFTPQDGESLGGELGYFSLAVEFEYQTLSGSTFGSAQGEVYVAGWEL